MYLSYVKAIADVITILEASLVPIEVIDATEKIVEQLVIDYPKLPPQFKVKSDCGFWVTKWDAWNYDGIKS